MGFVLTRLDCIRAWRGSLSEEEAISIQQPLIYAESSEGGNRRRLRAAAHKRALLPKQDEAMAERAGSIYSRLFRFLFAINNARSRHCRPGRARIIAGSPENKVMQTGMLVSPIVER